MSIFLVSWLSTSFYCCPMDLLHSNITGTPLKERFWSPCTLKNCILGVKVNCSSLCACSVCSSRMYIQCCLLSPPGCVSVAVAIIWFAFRSSTITVMLMMRVMNSMAKIYWEKGVVFALNQFNVPVQAFFVGFLWLVAIAFGWRFTFFIVIYRFYRVYLIYIAIIDGTNHDILLSQLLF